MKFKRLVAGGLAGAAVVTLGVLPPSEASADDISGCPSGRFCVWEDAAYSGRLQVFDLDAQKRISVHDFGVTSYWNRTRYPLCGAMLEICGWAGKGRTFPVILFRFQAQADAPTSAGKVRPDAHRSP
jgi:hypothetical protein